MAIEDGYRYAASLLPREVQLAADRLSPEVRRRAEDFRLRAGFPASVLSGGAELSLDTVPLGERQLREVLERASNYSYHTVSDELCQGYLAAKGGVRIGVCGRAVGDGGIFSFQEISSVSIRIPHQVSLDGLEALRLAAGYSVLVVAPPGAGKTTLLRALIRRESARGVRVSVADERGELAALWEGRPQFDLGRCTDVMGGVRKAASAILLLRAMNPQVIAMDEISSQEDAKAVMQIAGCGVRIFATVHGASVEALQARKVFRRLLREKLFQKALTISRTDTGARSYHVENL